jgi:hypothetical protein
MRSSARVRLYDVMLCNGLCLCVIYMCVRGTVLDGSRVSSTRFVYLRRLLSGQLSVANLNIVADAANFCSNVSDY